MTMPEDDKLTMDHCGDCAHWCFDVCLLDGPGTSPDDEACEGFEKEEGD